MPKYFLYPIFTVIFAVILLAVVPKKEIKRLSLYGIIFGGIMDSAVHYFGYLTGLFSWINYGPFGFIGVHIFSGLAWSMFFISYFYFLPHQKPLNYVYTVAGIFFATLFYNVVIDMGILKAVSKIWLPIFGFTFWFSVATWGYYKLNCYIDSNPY